MPRGSSGALALALYISRLGSFVLGPGRTPLGINVRLRTGAGFARRGDSPGIVLPSDNEVKRPPLTYMRSRPSIPANGYAHPFIGQTVPHSRIIEKLGGGGTSPILNRRTLRQIVGGGVPGGANQYMLCFRSS